MNTSIKDFVDVGDPSAPIGSPAWCQAAHVQLCATKRQTDWEVRRLKYDLLEFKNKERWKHLPGNKGQPFESWEEYVETPEPDGLGMPSESIKAVLKALDNTLIGQVLRKQPGRPKKGEENYSNGIIKGGNNAKYLKAVLQRDHREILAAYERGEFKSVRAAAIAAGIITPPTPIENLRHWWAKASDEERESFRKEITT